MSEFPTLRFARATGYPSVCSECGAVVGAMTPAEGRTHMSDHWDNTLALLADAWNAEREAIIHEAVRRAIEP